MTNDVGDEVSGEYSGEDSTINHKIHRMEVESDFTDEYDDWEAEYDNEGDLQDFIN